MWVVLLCRYFYDNYYSQKMFFFFFKYGLLKLAPPLIWCFLVGRRDFCRSIFFFEFGEFHPFRTPRALRRHDRKAWNPYFWSYGGWLEGHESCPVCSFQEVPNLSDKKINQIDRSQNFSESLTWFTRVWTTPPSNLEETLEWLERWWLHPWRAVDTLEPGGASPILDRKLTQVSVHNGRIC